MKILKNCKFGLLLIATTLATACKGGSFNAKTLNIYLYKGGYGTEWLNAVGKAFETDPLVKEKYGSVKIKVRTVNALDDYAKGQIEGLSNMYDIYFGMNLQSEIGKTGGNRKPYYVDLNDVYESKVLGEDITVGEKMLASAREANAIADGRGKTTYYTMPWAGGYNGIMYNPDILEKYNIEVPVTTDQLIKANKKITVSDPDHYSIIQGCNKPESCYWTYLYPTWWAQYEGYGQYINFWYGKLSDEEKNYSNIDIFKQLGRLTSLKALEELFMDFEEGGQKYNNMFQQAESTDYLTAQTNFFQGKGAFMACGDWYHNEMADFIAQAKERGQSIANVRMMRTPVNSAIIDRLSTINDDDTLSAVIKAIDNNETSYTDVSEEDFKAVVEARQMIYSTGNYHTAVIPYVCKKVELAKGFLGYLATDKANDLFIQKSGGSCMFYKYDLKSKNPDLYNSLNATSKMMVDLYNNKVHEAVPLPIPNNFRIFREGGVTLLNAHPVNQLEINFRIREPLTAQKYYDDDIAYWTPERWAILQGKLA